MGARENKKETTCTPQQVTKPMNVEAKEGERDGGGGSPTVRVQKVREQDLGLCHVQLALRNGTCRQVGEEEGGLLVPSGDSLGGELIVAQVLHPLHPRIRLHGLLHLSGDGQQAIRLEGSVPQGRKEAQHKTRRGRREGGPSAGEESNDKQK